MDQHLEDLRSEEFSRAIAGGYAVPIDLTAPPPVAPLRDRLCGSPAATLIALGASSLCLLLLLRPPFILKFEYDQRRPWRGCSKVSWVSVIVVTLVVMLCPLLASLVAARAAARAF